jgi:GDPmannose 4,6-dehydratase
MKAPGAAKLSLAAKISRAVAAIKHGAQKELFLGHWTQNRDWGYAPEYVEGMWRIVQLGEGDDFVPGYRRNAHLCASSSRRPSRTTDLDWKNS